MKTTVRLLALIVMLTSAMLLSACGSKPVTLADLPVYPGASELQAGESTIADTLQNNGQQDAALREAMGAGGSTVQKGFDLPADAGWDQVKSFYVEQLKSGGWAEGMSGPAGNIASQVMEQANQGNELFQTALFSKDKQTLTLIRVADPIDPSKVQLILSLSSQ
jgi:hypothetical protein